MNGFSRVWTLVGIAAGVCAFDGAARSVVAAIAGSLGSACPAKRSSRPVDRKRMPVAAAGWRLGRPEGISVAWARARGGRNGCSACACVRRSRALLILYRRFEPASDLGRCLGLAGAQRCD
jgi:hypothetical protein